MVDSGHHMEVPPVEVLQVMSRASWARPTVASGGQHMDVLLAMSFRCKGCAPGALTYSTSHGLEELKSMQVGHRSTWTGNDTF